MNAFVAELLASGAEAATARARQLSLRPFSAWLAEEGEIGAMSYSRPPKLDQNVTARLTEEQCRALVRACAGKDFPAPG